MTILRDMFRNILLVAIGLVVALPLTVSDDPGVTLASASIQKGGSPPPPPPTPVLLAGLRNSVLSTPGLAPSQATVLAQLLDLAGLRIRQGQYGAAISLLRSFNSYVSRFPMATADRTSLLGQSNLIVATLTSLPTGLVGYWKLDEGAGLTTADSSGNGVTGTLINNAAWTTSGKFGNALSLSPNLETPASSPYVDLGSTPGFPSGLSPRSMTAWAKTNSILTGNRWIMAYGSPGTGNAMFIGMIGTAVWGGGYNGDDVFQPNAWNDITNWHHVALTYDGATATLYFDGVQVASQPKNWVLVPGVSRLGQQVNGSEFWDGMIDDIRLYSRVLTSAEISALAGN